MAITKITKITKTDSVKEIPVGQDGNLIYHFLKGHPNNSKLNSIFRFYNIPEPCLFTNYFNNF
jgi:hypothetical protein